jgi:hypothetical protein
METYLGSGSIAPLLNLGSRLRWVASFMPRPLYHRNHLIGSWVEARKITKNIETLKLKQRTMEQDIPSGRLKEVCSDIGI